MKRDLELMREILLRIENSSGSVPIQWLKDLSEPPEKVGYHVELLLDAGYIDGRLQSLGEAGYIVGFISRLTNSGHDYLDNVRDPKVWAATKSELDKVGGGGALEFVKDMAARVMAKIIESSMGG